MVREGLKTFTRFNFRFRDACRLVFRPYQWYIMDPIPNINLAILTSTYKIILITAKASFYLQIFIQVSLVFIFLYAIFQIYMPQSRVIS